MRTRKDWINHIREHNPALYEQLTGFGEMFQARVQSVTCPCADCRWPDPEKQEPTHE